MPVVRAALRGLLNSSDQTINVFTFSSDLIGDAVPNASAVSEWIQGLYSAAVKGILSGVWNYTDVQIETVSGGLWSFVSSAPCAGNGTSEADPVPQQIAAVVTGITASRRRGKKFIAGLTETVVSNGVLTPAAVTALNAYGTAMILPFADGSDDWTPGVCRPDGTDFIPFTSFRVNPIVGTQRRRKQGSGA